MKRFNKVNPTKNNGDRYTHETLRGRRFARIIEAAKQVRATAGLAKRVQTEQIQRWLLAGETPESIFTLLKLDDAGESLFTQSQVVTWAKFLDDFNKADSTSATTLFSFLKSRYDEDDFVKMLIAAKNVPSTEKIATRIQAEQTALWLEKGKNPGVVFKLLKLDDVDVSIMVNPFFAAWVKYTEAFSKIHYGTKITTISVLSKYYRDDVLAKMILAAMKSPGTSDMATRLFTDQMRTWYFRKFAPEHVFKLLRLDQTKVPLLENPLFNVWARFVPHYRSLRPKEGGDLLTELKKVFSDERELITMLVQAWNVPKTNKSAMQILSAQLDRWVSAKTDPLVVFYLLRAEGAGKKDVRKLLYEEYRNALARLMKAPVRRIRSKNCYMLNYVALNKFVHCNMYPLYHSTDLVKRLARPLSPPLTRSIMRVFH
ncbi:hypothetical protein AM588_10002203 [Phytophthora nicotianae]|uniref:RxLR effector PexRD54 WY domain-containing protein n=1 Tax=Phytophthora nicotianae TaxID=4792 RepID=A0A0W8CZH0_PHYNI|nr:hypothetical protein AM588_10002203 [Phytophthora nicotianae]